MAREITPLASAGLTLSFKGESSYSAMVDRCQPFGEVETQLSRKKVDTTGSSVMDLRKL